MGDRYHYIRNYKLDRPLFNYGHKEMMAIDYPDSKYGYFAKIRSMYESGLLNEIQAAPFVIELQRSYMTFKMIQMRP